MDEHRRKPSNRAATNGCYVAIGVDVQPHLAHYNRRDYGILITKKYGQSSEKKA